MGSDKREGLFSCPLPHIPACSVISLKRSVWPCCYNVRLRHVSAPPCLRDYDWPIKKKELCQTLACQNRLDGTHYYFYCWGRVVFYYRQYFNSCFDFCRFDNYKMLTIRFDFLKKETSNEGNCCGWRLQGLDSQYLSCFAKLKKTLGTFFLAFRQYFISYLKANIPSILAWLWLWNTSWITYGWYLSCLQNTVLAALYKTQSDLFAEEGIWLGYGPNSLLLFLQLCLALFWNSSRSHPYWLTQPICLSKPYRQCLALRTAKATLRMKTSFSHTWTSSHGPR